jgi:hypothetical protein
MGNKTDERLELERQANELGIVFPPNIGDKKLQEKIDAVNAEKAETANPDDKDKENEIEPVVPKENQKMYAYCRVLGGVKIDYIDADGKKSIILKSGKKVAVAGDKQTFKFDLNISEYGVTQLTPEEFKVANNAVSKTKMFKKFFVFFAATKDEGDTKAAACIKVRETTGVEPLTEDQLIKEIKRFTEDN